MHFEVHWPAVRCTRQKGAANPKDARIMRAGTSLARAATASSFAMNRATQG